jgi:hypothetical protein
MNGARNGKHPNMGNIIKENQSHHWRVYTEVKKET